jgi:hypothetical protein
MEECILQAMSLAFFTTLETNLPKDGLWKSIATLLKSGRGVWKYKGACIGGCFLIFLRPVFVIRDILRTFAPKLRI